MGVTTLIEPVVSYYEQPTIQQQYWATDQWEGYSGLARTLSPKILARLGEGGR